MKLRAGIVGLGDAWESRHKHALRALSDRFEIKAVCCEVAHLAEQAAKDFRGEEMDGFRALCARNDVDSEEIAGRLEAGGFTLVEEAEGADAVLVNTCGFVDVAKKDSVDTILAAADLRDEGQAKAVVAVGCLAERYGKDLADTLPEADAVLGFDDVPSARLARPSLSTVRQPAEDLGREGLRQLAAQQGARGPASSRVLPTELLLRRSCGCVVIEGSLASGANVPVAGRGIETSFVQARQIILAELMRAAQIVVEPNTIAAHMKTIRQRFRTVDPDFDAIRTERSLGYRWVS